MKNFIKFLFVFFLIVMVVFPVIMFAQDNGLVPCQDGCKFNDFLILVNNVVNFVLIKMFLPIAAGAFCWAGFLIITSGGDEHKLKKGKSVFFAVVIGFAVAVAAWIIVHTFLAVLGYDASWIGF